MLNPLTVRDIRTQISSQKFNSSAFFEPLLRTSLRSADLEQRIVETFDGVANLVAEAGEDVDDSATVLQNKISVPISPSLLIHDSPLFTLTMALPFHL